MVNVKNIFEEELRKRVEGIINTCSMYGIPCFMTFCVSDSEEEGSEFRNFIYGSVSNGIKLQDDQIAKHINVANGFETIPPQATPDFGMFDNLSDPYMDDDDGLYQEIDRYDSKD